jgi:hypothetical protein
VTEMPCMNRAPFTIVINSAKSSSGSNASGGARFEYRAGHGLFSGLSFFSAPHGKFRNNSLIWAVKASFHIHSNSLLTHNPSSNRCEPGWF